LQGREYAAQRFARSDGSVDKYTAATFEKVGEWLAVNGAAAYGEKYPTAPVYSANTLTAVSADKDLKTFYLWNWVGRKTECCASGDIWTRRGKCRISLRASR
jgi:Tfp pilus assembly protein PilV